MTVGQWLDTRKPTPPPALSTRVREAIGDSISRPASEAPDILLSASEQVVRALLKTGSTSRDTAIDLLAADALVTYALEAASEAPESMRERALDAMRRIAAVTHAPA